MKSLLLELETQNILTKKNNFLKQTDLFLLYVKKWENPFEKIKVFRWVQLNINCPTWGEIQ